jgi:hypothetical protein
MIKMYLVFLLLSVAIGFGISMFRKLNKMEKLHFTKLIVYSTMCSLLALGALTVFVVLF